MKQKNDFLSDYLRSNRKGSREAELMISVGWTAKDRPHKSRKVYDRKREKRDWKNDNSNSAFFYFRFLKTGKSKIPNRKLYKMLISHITPNEGYSVNE